MYKLEIYYKGVWYAIFTQMGNENVYLKYNYFNVIKNSI